MKPLLFLSLAAVATAATPVSDITVPPGFKVELLREAGSREGSWISMALDSEGRIYISPQGSIPESGMAKDSKWGGLWRSTVAEGKVTAWEKVPVPVGDSMGMLWAFDSLYVSGNGPDGRGIYRCKDTDGDTLPDQAVLWKKIPGGAGEHGAHALVLGPDKKSIYIVHGNATGLIDGIAPDSPYRNWGEDDLLPKLKDPTATFFDNIKAPYGYVLRTDEHGTKWQLLAGGFRNPYDIDFNADGELFTYDSDMEWDRGLPWYRPTRVLHIVPGGEYGFREGSAKMPAYYPDTLPAVVDIGLGCPTGVKFGTHSTFPQKYRSAFFVCDWTYGRILAVHMKEKGASYSASNPLKSTTFPKDAESSADVEPFVIGKGMPVTDVEFLKDGSMVFTTGGRGTSAGLYRVSWAGKKQPSQQVRMSWAEKEIADRKLDEISTKIRDLEWEIWSRNKDAPKKGVPVAPSEQTLRQRKDIESLKAEFDEILNPRRINNIGPIVPYRDSFEILRDVEAFRKLSKAEQEKEKLRALRSSARGVNPFGIGIGDVIIDDGIHQIVRKESVSHEYFAARMAHRQSEDIGHAAVFLSQAGTYPPEIAVKRLIGYASDPLIAQLQPEVLEALKAFPLAQLPDDLKLLKLRILQLTFARHGRPSLEWQKVGLEKLLASYPAKGERAAELNRELSQLLIWLSQPELGDLNRSGDIPVADSAPKPEIKASSDKHAIGDRNVAAPIANPGAAVHPGRKGSDFHSELGRQVIEKTLALMEKAPSQEEQITYALNLRWAHGWSPEQRERYFRWFHEKGARLSGGNSLAGFIRKIHAEAAARVPDAEKAALAKWLAPLTSPAAESVKPRAFVKAWTLAELEKELDALKSRQPDVARGRDLYAAAQCSRCHLFKDAGGNVGPDLSAVAQRFQRRDILEAIVDPNKVVSDQYALTTLTVIKFGGGEEQVTGLLQEETSGTIRILTDPFAGSSREFYHNVVKKKEKAAVSLMPPALLNTLTAEEVADLLAFLGGK